jgi:hypothetical protein
VAATFGIYVIGQVFYDNIYKEWREKQIVDSLNQIKIEAINDHTNAISSINQIYTQAIEFTEKHECGFPFKLMDEYVFPILENAAIKGNSDAQYYIACYYMGWKIFDFEEDPTIINHDKAAYWFLKAAEQGHLTAQACLGMRYKYGEGVKQDFKKCIKWLTSAAENGEFNAQYWLGLLYAKGLHVKSGKIIYTKGGSIDLNNPPYILVTCWYDGKATEALKDKEGNFALSNGQDIYYLMEYNKSPVESKDIFLNDFELETGIWSNTTTYIKKDIKQAIHYLQLASNKGHDKAFEELQKIYAE